MKTLNGKNVRPTA